MYAKPNVWLSWNLANSVQTGPGLAGVVSANFMDPSFLPSLDSPMVIACNSIQRERGQWAVY